MHDSEREFTMFHWISIALDILALIFVIILEIILRVSDKFPVRQVTFTCTDADISLPQDPGVPYPYFDYHAVASYGVVIGLSFGLPVIFIIVGELCRWRLAEERQQSLRVTNSELKVPQVARRIIRYVCMFVFGLLITMIFTDVLKIFAGRLRPCFLDICQVNSTTCGSGMMADCTADPWDVRYGRLSFPSLHTSVTAFAATFMAIYTHRTIVSRDLWIMRPFLVFAWMIMPVMAGISRYGMNQSHATDVFWGFIMGCTLAVYICVWCLNEFHEHVTGREVLHALRNYLYNRNDTPNDPYGPQGAEGEPYLSYAPTNTQTRVTSSQTLIIPRPHAQQKDFSQNDYPTNQTHNNASLPYDDTPRYPRGKQSSTLQRQLERNIDNYNRFDEQNAHM